MLLSSSLRAVTQKEAEERKVNYCKSSPLWDALRLLPGRNFWTRRDVSSPWTPHAQNHSLTHPERQRAREGERLSACSAVFAGFHIILCRSRPPTGKFSEIASFNYLLPTAATALAGWRCTGAGWDLKGGKKARPPAALHQFFLITQLSNGAPINFDLLCLRASTYRLAEVGWALACRSRKTLRFQSAGPLFRSLPPPVPATSTQTSACIRCKAHAHSHQIALISNSPIEKMVARFHDSSRFVHNPG